MSQSTEYKILWVDDDSAVLATAERLLRYQPFDLVTAESTDSAKELLRSSSFAVVIADQRMPHITGIEFLKFAERISPSTTRMLVTGFLEKDVIESAVNESSIYKFITKPWDDQRLLVDIQSAIDVHKAKTGQEHLLREASSQNQKLEELTSDLEKLVDERTDHIEKSKNLMERNLTKTRKLVLFIKELSSLRGLDELLLLLRKETKKFHQVGDPVLAYETHNERKKIISFNKREIIEVNAKEPWAESPRIRQNSTEDQKYLANQFSRPFAKVIAIPLQRKGWTKGTVPSVLFFENDLPADKLVYFIEFLSQRIQPIGIAVDRILLEYQAKFVSYQWESTFDGIDNPIAIIDEEYNVVRANQSFSRKSEDEKRDLVLGTHDQPGLMAEAVAYGKPTVTKVHSHSRIYNIFSYPIQLAGEDHPSHVINYYSDITNSRKLFGRVIQNEKLGEIGLLAGNIAHELNNPLTGIRSLAQVLLSEVNEEHAQVIEDLKEVEKAAGRSQGIIRNLLDFSNSDDESDVSEVDINEIVERTLPLLKTAMRNFNTHIELTENPAKIRIKTQLLQQVFFNLVANACQAMEDRGEIRISTTTEEGIAKLEVSDTGPGIPDQVIDHIFEPFFTTKKEGEGTGLGLSMSRSIVEKFGGKIDIKSQVGVGSSFLVSLPTLRE